MFLYGIDPDCYSIVSFVVTVGIYLENKINYLAMVEWQYIKDLKSVILASVYDVVSSAISKGPFTLAISDRCVLDEK